MAGTIQSVERAASILTLLAGAGRPLELVEVAAGTGLPKTTAHSLLTTLRSVGWVEQDRPGSGYRVTARMSGLAHAVDPADLRSVATPWMDRLASVSGLEVHLTWRQGDHAEVVQHVYRPDNSPQRLRLGERLPLHATASGKVLLAHPGRVAAGAEAPAHGLHGRLETFTRFTLTELGELEHEVASVRTHGHAVESGEYYPDVHSIAVPVHDPHGDPIAALAVLGPRHEVLDGPRADPEKLSALVRAAGSISRALAGAP